MADKDKSISEKNEEIKTLRDDYRDAVQESSDLWEKLVKSAEDKTVGLSPEDKQKLADIYVMLQKHMPKSGKAAAAVGSAGTGPVSAPPAPTAQTGTAP
jgi:hypothetical protein